MKTETIVKWLSIIGGTVVIITLGAAAITQSNEPFRYGIPIAVFLLIVSAALRRNMTN